LSDITPIPIPNVNIDLGHSIEKKEITNVLKIDPDKHKICEPFTVRAKRYKGLFGEIVWLIHVFGPKKFIIRQLN
jgi:hypothetical protein